MDAFVMNPSTLIIRGAGPLDEVFNIMLETGENVTWNVTKLTAAAQAGAFGAVRYAPTSDLPPARWESWDETDRAKVDWIKTHPDILNAPAICIAAPSDSGYAILCFADGQHRITARQELGLTEILFWLVPVEMERRFRVTHEFR